VGVARSKFLPNSFLSFIATISNLVWCRRHCIGKLLQQYAALMAWHFHPLCNLGCLAFYPPCWSGLAQASHASCRWLPHPPSHPWSISLPPLPLVPCARCVCCACCVPGTPSHPVVEMGPGTVRLQAAIEAVVYASTMTPLYIPSRYLKCIWCSGKGWGAACASTPAVGRSTAMAENNGTLSTLTALSQHSIQPTVPISTILTQTTRQVLRNNGTPCTLLSSRITCAVHTS
jgi:hypothetical protein